MPTPELCLCSPTPSTKSYALGLFAWNTGRPDWVRKNKRCKHYLPFMPKPKLFLGFPNPSTNPVRILAWKTGGSPKAMLPCRTSFNEQLQTASIFETQQTTKQQLNLTYNDNKQPHKNFLLYNNVFTVYLSKYVTTSLIVSQTGKRNTCPDSWAVL